MIDITGSGGITNTEKKLERISNWIGEQKLEKFALKGIVLAPGVLMENKEVNTAIIIGQNEAKKHLGGLQQIYRWLTDEDEKEDIALNKE